jgi:4-amino-4-deoxy-L-arabinose transferase-like glycosyltransferase
MDTLTLPYPPIRERGRRLRRNRLLALLGPPLLFLLAALALRSFAFLQAVFDTDEGLYMVQAREWLRGGWPIVAVWDMHPIGAPAMIATAFLVFGQSVETVRLLGVLCVAATAWALHVAARVGGAPWPVRLGAGMIYIAFSLRLGGVATNTEILFAPFVVLAMAVGVGATNGALALREPPRSRQLLLMGLSMGCAFAVKPVVTPEGCLAFALLTFPALFTRLLSPGRFLLWAIIYALLVLTPTGLFGLAYAVRGEFMAFVDGSFLAPLRYSLGRLPLAEAVRFSAVAALILIWPLLLAGLATARWAGRPGAAGRLTRIGLLWFACASIAVVGPGFFFQHYFLMWLPPLSLLAALGAWRFARLARAGGQTLAFGLTIAAVVVHSWLGAFVPRLDRGIGIALPDPVEEVAAAVRQELAPGETIFVANYHPVVYFLTGAEVPTRFIFPAHLTGAFHRLTGIDTDEEVRRILGTGPRFIVVDRGWWWGMRPEAAALIETALTEGYELAEAVTEERGPVEVWRRR